MDGESREVPRRGTRQKVSYIGARAETTHIAEYGVLIRSSDQPMHQSSRRRVNRCLGTRPSQGDAIAQRIAGCCRLVRIMASRLGPCSSRLPNDCPNEQ